MADDSNQPQRPRFEPEIIPPDRTRRSGREQPAWRSSGPAWNGATHRVYVGRIGPLGFAALMLVFALVAGIMVLAVIGAALLWLPIVVLVAVVAAFYRLLR